MFFVRFPVSFCFLRLGRCHAYDIHGKGLIIPANEPYFLWTNLKFRIDVSLLSPFILIKISFATIYARKQIILHIWFFPHFWFEPTKKTRRKKNIHFIAQISISSVGWPFQLYFSKKKKYLFLSIHISNGYIILKDTLSSYTITSASFTTSMERNTHKNILGIAKKKFSFFHYFQLFQFRHHNNLS